MVSTPYLSLLRDKFSARYEKKENQKGLSSRRTVLKISNWHYEINGFHNVYRLHETQNHQLNQKSSRSTRRIEEFCVYLVKAANRDF